MGGGGSASVDAYRVIKQGFGLKPLGSQMRQVLLVCVYFKLQSNFGLPRNANNVDFFSTFML